MQKRKNLVEKKFEEKLCDEKKKNIFGASSPPYIWWKISKDNFLYSKFGKFSEIFQKIYLEQLFEGCRWTPVNLFHSFAENNLKF